MNQFESFLAQQFEQYIRHRRNLGYSIETSRSHLMMFDHYLTRNHTQPQQLQPALFLQLQGKLPWEPRTINCVFSSLRVFFNYLVRIGSCKENPLHDVPALSEWHYLPFVFSPQQTNQLLGTLCNRIRKTQQYYLRDYGVYLAIILLARCGMRVSEPSRLFCSHYRSKENTVYIEKTKFKKDRLIPIPQSVAVEIDNYLQLRNSLAGNDRNPYLLVGKNLKGLSPAQVTRVFHQAVTDLDLAGERKTIANTTFGYPTPHSLRHSFAINTMMRIKQQGKSPQNALPVLADYMGHSKYNYTLKYLTVLNAEQRQGLAHFVTSKGTL